MTRLKTVLDAAGNAPALRVDVGDAIGGSEDYHAIEYRYLLRAFANLGYDALNIGYREARLSAAQLRQLKTNSPVPILSANLLDQATRRPLFDPYRIVQRGSYRIAIIGVVDPRGLRADLGDGLAIEAMEPALSRWVTELRPKADLLVLLAFTDEATLVRLAEQFYELQVILGGKVRQPAQELQKENRSLIFFVTNESRALGFLKLRLSEGAPPVPIASEIRLLHDRIPEAPELQQLARDYRQEVRRARLTVDDPGHLQDDAIPGVRAAASFVGSARCVDCHQATGAAWSRSRHAHAFATLVEKQADADPKCIGCHTIGFATATGYRREFGAQWLAHVGCESCHGPGSLHVRRYQGEREIDFVFRPLGAGDCQKCHFGEFSRPFNWDEFWPLIRHGQETTMPAADSKGE